MEKLPLVSIIMPIRNEANFIRKSLGSLLAQDYPPEMMEILIVDGMSDDGTRKIIQELMKERGEILKTAAPGHHGNGDQTSIVLLDNPGRIVPKALNIGLRQARGDIIMRMDGHCLVDTDYVRRCVELLRKTGGDNVGGTLKTQGKNLMGRAVSVATSSPFGVGGARFRYTNRPGWVDTVFPGVFHREVFDRIGGFDEELVRNQDDEFNFRLLQAGGRIWLDPSILVTYYVRSSFRSLWRQYFQYGFYKVRVIQKRRQVASWRHLVPAAFVSGLVFTSLLSLITGNKLWGFMVAGPYLLTNVLASLWTARRDWLTLPLLPLVFGSLHCSYGLGFLFGLWGWRNFWHRKS